jgi:ParB-like chromosome segregation protein Spo0J
MIIEKKKISELKPAPYNPRKSNEEQEKHLKASLTKFGVVEPIIWNKQSGYIVGGHFRIRELKKLGYKEVECVIVDLNEEDERELNIRLNANTGEWNWDELANDWDAEKLEDWGLSVPELATDVDYSILDDEDVEGQLKDMTNGVKKAIQIEFEAEHYEEAYELVKFWREQGGYVGGMIMEYLKAEKDKL